MQDEHVCLIQSEYVDVQYTRKAAVEDAVG